MIRINALLFLFFLSIPIIYAQSGSMDAIDYESFKARFTPFSRGCIPEEEKTKWPPDSGSVFAHHTPMFNRQDDMKRLSQYSGYILPGENMDQPIAGSQLAQVVAVRHTLERSRTRWPECTGALYYKMNDNYPAVSWSSVDWYGAPKTIHYFAQDAFSPVAAVVLFEHTDLSENPILILFNTKPLKT